MYQYTTRKTNNGLVHTGVYQYAINVFKVVVGGGHVTPYIGMYVHTVYVYME